MNLVLPIALVTCTLENAGQILFMRYLMTEPTENKFDFGVAVTALEAAKFLICIVAMGYAGVQ